MKTNPLTIIAGPCSIDENNLSEVYDIADISVTNSNGKTEKAIFGTRIVGMKSRTELNTSGSGMGIDFPVYMENLTMLSSGGCVRDLKVPPSVLMAEEVFKKTGMLIATEVMTPMIQLPQYEGRIPKNMLMPWNPAVEQLGWPIMQMGAITRKNGWNVGLKNGKWVGEHVRTANTEDYEGATTMEKTWAGLVTYLGEQSGDIILIHRGVDVPDKGDYRNAPVHNIAKRAKKATGCKLYFDPSHAHGPKMRQHITYAVIDAMELKMEDGSYLYDGILVETGTSATDTEQHITVDELKTLVTEIAKFRTIRSRTNS